MPKRKPRTGISAAKRAVIVEDFYARMDVVMAEMAKDHGMRQGKIAAIILDEQVRRMMKPVKYNKD